MEGSERRTQRAWVRPFGPCYFAARLTFVLLLPGDRVKAPDLRGFSPGHCTPTDEDAVSVSSRPGSNKPARVSAAPALLDIRSSGRDRIHMRQAQSST